MSDRTIDYLYPSIPGLENAESVGQARSILQDDDTPLVVLETTARALLGDPALNSLGPYREIFQGRNDYFEDEYVQRQGELLRALEDGGRRPLEKAVQDLHWYENARLQLAGWCEEEGFPLPHPSLVKDDLILSRLLALERRVDVLTKQLRTFAS